MQVSPLFLHHVLGRTSTDLTKRVQFSMINSNLLRSLDDGSLSMNSVVLCHIFQFSTALCMKVKQSKDSVDTIATGVEQGWCGAYFVRLDRFWSGSRECSSGGATGGKQDEGLGSAGHAL